MKYDLIPANLSRLEKTRRTGRLTFDIDWKDLPIAPDKRWQKPAWCLRQMEKVTGTIEREFMHAARIWTDAMPWECTVSRVAENPDIRLAFEHLQVSASYERMATSTIKSDPAFIWLDMGATDWGLRPVNSLWASIWGKDRVPLRAILAHEIAHTLGIGHIALRSSIMYAQPNDYAPRPVLQDLDLPRILPAPDSALFASFCSSLPFLLSQSAS